jgi:hypothetical protein
VLAGEHRNENPCVWGVGEHLEKGIKGYQASSILRIWSSGNGPPPPDWHFDLEFLISMYGLRSVRLS